VRLKLLFLAKVLGYSLGLFVLWNPISQAYIFILNELSVYLNPLRPMPTGSGEVLYKNSIYMIPFISLILATPKIPIVRRTGIIVIGMLVVLLIDFFSIQYVFYPEGKSSVYVKYLGFIYQSLKWLLPLLLWILPCYPYLGNLLNPQTEEASVPYYHCPICEAEHANIIKHIREVHGEKSFKIKKVKRFIAENPQLSS